MRVLLLVFLGWLLGKLWQRFQAWRSHRKPVGQLKELGVYGGTVDTRKIPRKPVESIEISTEPDGPAPFGYKTAWLEERFPEVQYFASYRVSSAYCWARYVDGACVRAYRMEENEVLWDEGDLTPEELALGFDRFPHAGREHGGGQCPDEESVLDIAAAWGVDPRFQKKTYPPSVSWVCD